MKTKTASPIAYRNSLPVFLCDRVVQNRDHDNALCVSFRCPCGQRHWHGWYKTDVPDVPQHRIEHCGKKIAMNEHGYYIVIAAPNTANLAPQLAADAFSSPDPAIDPTGESTHQNPFMSETTESIEVSEPDAIGSPRQNVAAALFWEQPPPATDFTLRGVK